VNHSVNVAEDLRKYRMIAKITTDDLEPLMPGDRQHGSRTKIETVQDTYVVTALE
jgi:hypothetical protein